MSERAITSQRHRLAEESGKNAKSRFCRPSLRAALSPHLFFKRVMHYSFRRVRPRHGRDLHAAPRTGRGLMGTDVDRVDGSGSQTVAGLRCWDRGCQIGASGAAAVTGKGSVRF